MEEPRRTACREGSNYTGHMDVDVLVSEWADELIEVPRAHLALRMRQDPQGVLVLHQEREIIRCHLTPGGMQAAGLIAEALGVRVPALGGEAEARVSTGVLFRAVSIARLDLANEASHFLLDRLLEEAEMQRGTSVSSG